MRRTRTRRARQIFPFLLNLNLKPLYSSRGGSTTRADPFMKNPTVVTLRLKPLYKWNVRNHRTFVLSAAWTQLCLLIITLSDLGYCKIKEGDVPSFLNFKFLVEN